VVAVKGFVADGVAGGIRVVVPVVVQVVVRAVDVAGVVVGRNKSMHTCA